MEESEMAVRMTKKKAKPKSINPKLAAIKVRDTEHVRSKLAIMKSHRKKARQAESVAGAPSLEAVCV